MKTLEIFDPGQCCTKDTCCHGGHSLLRIDAITDQLRGMGIEVKRHTLNYDPQAFMHNVQVNQMLQTKGVEVLPITLVDGDIVLMGEYPTTQQFSEWAGRELSVPTESDFCCC